VDEEEEESNGLFFWNSEAGIPDPPLLYQNRTAAQLRVAHEGVGDWEQCVLLKNKELLSYLSTLPQTPLGVGELHRLGQNSSPEGFVDYAQFLRRELAIRMADTAVELARMPHGLSENQDIRDVCGWCAHAATELMRAPAPDTAEKEIMFTRLLERKLAEHKPIVMKLALGCRQLKRELGPEEWGRIQPDVDWCMLRFHTVLHTHTHKHTNTHTHACMRAHTHNTYTHMHTHIHTHTHKHTHTHIHTHTHTHTHA
jgi:hypothetical protein